MDPAVPIRRRAGSPDAVSYSSPSRRCARPAGARPRPPGALAPTVEWPSRRLEARQRRPQLPAAGAAATTGRPHAGGLGLQGVDEERPRLAAADPRVRRPKRAGLQPRRHQPDLRPEHRDGREAAGRPDHGPHRHQPGPLHPGQHSYTFKPFGRTLTLDQTDDYPQHSFDSHHILPDWRKREMVGKWLRRGTRTSRRTSPTTPGACAPWSPSASSEASRWSCSTCPSISRPCGPASTRPATAIATSARAVATEYGVPYVDFVADVPFVEQGLLRQLAPRPDGPRQMAAQAGQDGSHRLAEYGIPEPPPYETAPAATETVSSTVS